MYVCLFVDLSIYDGIYNTYIFYKSCRFENQQENLFYSPYVCDKQNKEPSEKMIFASQNKSIKMFNEKKCK